jgi:hypothetical protein
VARPRLRRETLIPASCPAWLRGAPEEKTRCLRSQIHVAAPSYRLQPAIFLVTRDLMICGPRSVPRCSSPHSPRHQTIAGRCLAIDVNLARHQASTQWRVSTMTRRFCRVSHHAKPMWSTCPER